MQIGEGASSPLAGASSESESEEIWIELCLVDSDGQPIADAPYELEAPDGTVISGRLDASGVARIEGLAEAGRAQVRWPEHEPMVSLS